MLNWMLHFCGVGFAQGNYHSGIVPYVTFHVLDHRWQVHSSPMEAVSKS